MDIKARRLRRNRIERAVATLAAVFVVFVWVASELSAGCAVLSTALALGAAIAVSLYNLSARKNEGFKQLVMVDHDGKVVGVTDELRVGVDLFGRRHSPWSSYALYPIEARENRVKWSSDYSSGWNNGQGKYAEFELSLVYVTGGDAEKAAQYCMWVREHSVRKELARVCRNELSEMLRSQMARQARVDSAARIMHAAAMARLTQNLQGSGVTIASLHCLVELTESSRVEWDEAPAKVDQIA